MTPEIEISQATLNSLSNCLLVDMRDAESVAYGVIPGAVPLPPERLEAEVPARCAGRPVVLYCARGQFSVDAAEELRRLGVEAYSLEGGYAGWLLYRMQREQATSLQQQIEEGIRKTWHKRLFSKFAKAIRTYDLVKPGDRIAVCISGGKDSMLMAKLFQELYRHHKFPFELKFLVMDPGYNADQPQGDRAQRAASGHSHHHLRDGHFRHRLQGRKEPLLPVRPDAPGVSVQQGAGTGLQQDRAGPSLRRRDRDHPHGDALRRAGADHDAQAAQHQLSRHGADSPACT